MEYIKKILNFKNKPKKNKEKYFFISAFPKSGSSFISLVLKDLLKVDLVDLINSHLGEQDMYEPKLKKNLYINTISKHHTLATIPNVNLFNKYEIRPVILTRNLPDVIVSLRDHISKTLIWPHFYVPYNFNVLPLSEQFDFLIDFATPWYIHFFSSWKNVEKENKLDTKFIQYENFHQNKLSVIKEILGFWKFEFSDEEINKSIKFVEGLSGKQNRVNKAVMYRGQDLLTKHQLMRIESYIKYYQNVDFSTLK